MVIKKAFFIVNLILIPLLGLSQNENTDSLYKVNVMNSIIKNQNNIAVYYKKSKIPSALKKSINSLFGYKFYLANPNKKYNSTDLKINFLLPDKQLLFLVVYDKNYALVYNQGGRGISTHCILAKLNKNKVIYVNDFYIDYKTDNIEQFILNLMENRFSENTMLH